MNCHPTNCGDFPPRSAFSFPKFRFDGWSAGLISAVLFFLRGLLFLQAWPHTSLMSLVWPFVSLWFGLVNVYVVSVVVSGSRHFCVFLTTFAAHSTCYILTVPCFIFLADFCKVTFVTSNYSFSPLLCESFSTLLWWRRVLILKFIAAVNS